MTCVFSLNFAAFHLKGIENRLVDTQDTILAIFQKDEQRDRIKNQLGRYRIGIASCTP